MHEKVYPWLLSHRVQTAFKRLPPPPLLSKVWGLISLFLAWWSVPFVLGLIWLRYLRCREWNETIIHIVVLAVAMALAWSLSRLAVQTLEGQPRDAARIDRHLLTRIAVTVGIGMVLGVISLGAFEGVPPRDMAREECPPQNGEDAPKRMAWVVPQVLNWLSFGPFNWVPFADFVKAKVSVKPPGEEPVTGAEFSGRELPYLRACEAFLVSANLERAKLPWANLSGAKLGGANLTDVYLQNAKLEFASMSGAFLMRANLQGANLHAADLVATELSGADLKGANLTSATFTNADLTGADLQGADLKTADFVGAWGLTTEQVCEAKNWDEAYYDGEFRDKLVCPESEQEKE